MQRLSQSVPSDTGPVAAFPQSFSRSVQISNAPAALSTDGGTTANAAAAAIANAAARGRSLTAPADLELELEQLLTQVDGSGLPLLPSEQEALERPSLSMWADRSAARLPVAGPASARSLHTSAAADAAAAAASSVDASDLSVGFPTASTTNTSAGGLGMVMSTAGSSSSATATAAGVDAGIINPNPNPNMLNPELDNAAFAAAAARTAAKQAFDPEGAAAAGMPLSTQVPDGHGGLAGTVGGASPHVQYGNGGPYLHTQQRQPYAGVSSSNYGSRGHVDDGGMSGSGSSLRGIASAVGSAAAVGANIMQLGATVAGSVAETVAAAGANVVREGLRTAAMPLQGAAAALDAAARSLQSQGGTLHGSGGPQQQQMHHDGSRIPRNDDHYDVRAHGGHHNLGEAPHASTATAYGGRANGHDDALHHHDAVRHDVAGAPIGISPPMVEPVSASGFSGSRVSAASGSGGGMMSRSGGPGLHDPHSRLFSTQASAAAQRMRAGRARASTLPSALPSSGLLMRGLHTASAPNAAATVGAGGAGGEVTERDAHAASGADYSGVAALPTDDAQAEARAYAAGQRQRSSSPSAGMRVAGIRNGQQPDAADTAQPGMTADARAGTSDSAADSAQLTERGDVSDNMPSQAITSESPSTAEHSRRMAQHSKPGPAGADALGRNPNPSHGKKAASQAASDATSKSAKDEASQDVYQGGFGGAHQPPPLPSGTVTGKREAGGMSSSDMESTPLIYGAPAGAGSGAAVGKGSKGGISMDGPSVHGGGGRRGLHTAAAAAAPPVRKPSAADRDEDLDARGGSLVGAHTMASISDLQTIGGELHHGQQNEQYQVHLSHFVVPVAASR